MSASTPTCRICSLPLAQHWVALVDGAAHTVVRGTNGETIAYCSLEYASRERLQGEIDRLGMIVRSLKNRAGRAWRREEDERAGALEQYAGLIAGQRDRLIAGEEEWYSW